MPLISKKTVIGVKAETTPGTPIALSNSDAIYAKNVKIEPEFQFHQREDDATMGHRTGVIGAQKGKVSFDVELKGSGTSATSPHYALVLFPACGGVESTSPAGTWHFSSAISAQKPVTIGVYEDGLLKRVSGAVGTFNLEYENGKPSHLHFELEGQWVEPTDAAMLTPESDAIKPAPFKAATLTLGAQLAPVSKLSISMGGKLVSREDPTKDCGYTFGCVVDRDFTGKIDPEAVLVATNAVFATLKAGTEMALSVTTGNTAGNYITVAAPKAQWKNVGEGDREGIRTNEIDIQLNKNSGDDELTIAFVDPA